MSLKKSICSALADQEQPDLEMSEVTPHLSDKQKETVVFCLVVLSSLSCAKGVKEFGVFSLKSVTFCGFIPVWIQRSGA